MMILNGKKRGKPVSQALVYLSVTVVAIWSAIPFFWAVQTSIKFVFDVASRVPVLWGYDTTADAYRSFWFEDETTNMWKVGGFLALLAVVLTVLIMVGRRVRKGWPFYGAAFAAIGAAMWTFPKMFQVKTEYSFFLNSVIITAATVLISITIGMLAGYGLARYTGVSGAVILIIALAFRALPRSAFVLPYFFAAKTFNLLDRRIVIILALVAINQPFTIWMFRSFFMQVPRELEEAAMMDGAGRLVAFRRVIVPIMWPAIIATSLFTTLLAYNEFLFVRLLAPTKWTLPVAIVALTGGEGSGSLTESAAAAVSITFPIIVLIVLFQKHLVKGLGAGAVKG